MLIALDANIWVKERLLRSATGAGFLNAVRRTDAKILLTNVTRDEVVARAVEEGLKAVAKVEAGLLTVQSFIGSRQGYTSPTKEAFRDAALARIGELGPLLVEEKETLEHHRHALARVIEHRPPAAASEQYRDCLLWEMLAGRPEPDLVLISQDTDFRDKGDSHLASALREESGGRVSFFTSVGAWLAKMEESIPPVDEASIRTAIIEHAMPQAVDYAQRHSIRIGEVRDLRLKLFATEDPNADAAVFTLKVAAVVEPESSSDVFEKVSLFLSGNCMLSTGNDVQQLTIDSVWLESLEGSRLPGAEVFLRAMDYSGIHEVPYTVRQPIPGGQTQASS
jgi:hypothetical protein